MYSPKIKEDLIPILYRFAKEKGKPMTWIVDDILRPILIEYQVAKEIPYCTECYSKLELYERTITAYCKECKTERFVMYSLPTEGRKEVV